MSEEEDAIEDKSREKNPDTPCKSLLYCTDPDLISLPEEEADDTPKYRKSWREKDLQEKIKNNHTHEDEWYVVSTLEQYEKKGKKSKYQCDTCCDADLSFIHEAVFIIFSREVGDMSSVHRGRG